MLLLIQLSKRLLLVKANVVSAEVERSFSKLERLKGHIGAKDAPSAVTLWIFKASQPWKNLSHVFIQVNMTHLL